MGVRRQLLRDYLKYPFEILKHFVVPESERFETMRFDYPRSIFVSRSVFRVLTTINFDHDLWIETCEVRNESFNGMLATESDAQLNLAD